MVREEFQRIMGEVYDEIVGLNNTKGHDYAGDQDALRNFKSAADRLSLTPYQIWSVYGDKHWSAIMTFAAEGDVKSEPIEGRIKDCILYLFLLYALALEKGDIVAFGHPDPLRKATS